jgi:hypothetical protein
MALARRFRRCGERGWKYRVVGIGGGGPLSAGVLFPEHARDCSMGSPATGREEPLWQLATPASAKSATHALPPTAILMSITSTDRHTVDSNRKRGGSLGSWLPPLHREVSVWFRMLVATAAWRRAGLWRHRRGENSAGPSACDAIGGSCRPRRTRLAPDPRTRAPPPWSSTGRS